MGEIGVDGVGASERWMGGCIHIYIWGGCMGGYIYIYNINNILYFTYFAYSRKQRSKAHQNKSW